MKKNYLPKENILANELKIRADIDLNMNKNMLWNQGHYIVFVDAEAPGKRNF